MVELEVKQTVCDSPNYIFYTKLAVGYPWEKMSQYNPDQVVG